MNAPRSKTVAKTGRSRNALAVFARLRVFYFLLLFVVAGLFIVLGWGLTRDPGVIPSVLIGKPVPLFDLPPVQGRILGLSTRDLKGKVSLVNVFASWCVPCRAEHPLFMRLKAEGVVPIHGLNYKDQPQDVAKWLDDLGEPKRSFGDHYRSTRAISPAW